MIRLQRIYNFLLFHAILYSVLDIIGLYYTLLYYFWDKPINRTPSPELLFFAYFRVSQKKNIKRSPNAMKPLGAWFLELTRSRRLGPYIKKQRRRPWGRGRALHPRGPLVAPPTYSFLLYIPMYPQTTRYGAKNLIPPLQLPVSTRSHLGACSGAPPERASTTEGFYINTIASPMKCE